MADPKKKQEASAPTVADLADEVEAEMHTYRDHEEVFLPVPVLRELLRRSAGRRAA